MKEIGIHSRAVPILILRWMAYCVLVLSVLCGQTGSLMAAEPPEPVSNVSETSPAAQDIPVTPDTGTSMPAEPQGEAAAPEEAREESPASSTEPFREAPSDPDALLDAALEAMEQAVAELAGESPTAKAVAEQQMAVDHLKELLAAASQSQSGNSKSSPKNKPSSEPDSAQEQPSDSSSSDSNGSGGRRSDDENAAESSENIAGPTQPGTGVLGSGAKANNVWGHLPPREREALFRSLSDNFLPEYESQIKRYYEALAERK